MTFKDLIESNYTLTSLSTKEILISFLVTSVIAIYIFFCYRLMTRMYLYSKNFNLSLIAVAISTCALILTIQSSIVISLGMVGALSIVRFRTAVKDSLDLSFLFWSICVGIICGVGFYKIAIFLSIFMTVFMLLFDRFPIRKQPMLMVINYSTDEGSVKELDELLESNRNNIRIKSKTQRGDNAEIILEYNPEKNKSLLDDVSKIKNVKSVSVLDHSGEIVL